MDIQLLMRLDRMLPPRILTLQADFAAAKRLHDDGFIEASPQMHSTKSGIGLHAMLVKVITAKGSLAVAQEKARSDIKQKCA
ncbi:hypothetical protein [Variovorax sp. RCC_210]|jgi:hypothetical protein|uniref:hypothetical protein n=1 Tax=Variovorax sp. RCC_210 TaxID=3239217 RepID=UPI000D5EE158